MRIGLDIDDVLADFTAAFRREAEQISGKKIDTDPTRWDFSEWVGDELEKKVWDKINGTVNWFEYYVDPLPGVEHNLAYLTDKYETYFVTSRRGASLYRQTLNWLFRRGVVFPQVVMTKHKGIVASALGLNVFLDDKPENLAEIVIDSPFTRVYLQDKTYNQHEQRFTRVNDFEVFLKIYEQASY